jgi:hypothetical protein
MTEAELAEAISAHGEGTRRPKLFTSLAPAFAHARRRVTTVLEAFFGLAFLRRAKPVRVLVLSVAALAAGGLGLMTAYAISPDEGSAAQVLVTNGTTYQIATVTGPGGTTTVAVTKTKEGKTRIVPVRILDTVAGPGGMETVSVQLLGPARTVTDQQLQIVNQTQTDVVTVVEPTTVVVTDVRTETVREVETQHVTVVQTDTVVVTVTDTETVVVTETITVPGP